MMLAFCSSVRVPFLSITYIGGPKYLPGSIMTRYAVPPLYGTPLSIFPPIVAAILAALSNIPIAPYIAFFVEAANEA